VISGHEVSKVLVAPTIVAMVERFDLASFWFASRILTSHTPKKQAKMISKLTKVAEVIISKLVLTFLGFDDNG
jgi:hypothetical protein